MHPQTMFVTFGCLLHDVGKLAHRAGEPGTHSQSGYAFVKQAFNHDIPQPILDCVRWHHADALRTTRPACDNIAYVAYIADNISSAADRREEGDETRFDRTMPLSPVFLHLNEIPAVPRQAWVEALPQDGSLRLPFSGNGRLDSIRYGALLNQLKNKLSGLQLNEEWLNSLLAELEIFTGNVPASTFRGESPDISLFDHLKITAAVGACISEYLIDNNRSDYHSVLFKNQSDFWNEEAFLLYSADFSGIQKFIHTISTENALRTLRSRSFFLDFVMEHYVDEMLSACGVSRANLLYSGGGHCYLLLPNTHSVRKAVDDWNTRFNEWLFQQFGMQLFLAHGYTTCTANQLTNTPAQDAPYKQMFRRVSSAIAQHKLCRVNAAQLRRLNQQPIDERGRECRICGRIDTLVEDRQRCHWCALFEDISRKIQTCPVYVVSSKPALDHHFVLPSVEGNAYIWMTDEQNARKRLKQENSASRVYTKNAFYSGLRYSTCLYVGDYAFSNSMEELAKSSAGIQRLAVCRMDVDNLGHAFVAGFEQPDKPEDQRFRYVTISRTAAFSRQMSLFFKRYINGILSGEYGKKIPLQVSIVYSGGDDVFLVGAWNDVIEGAIRIRQTLEAFTCGALHISAGVGIFNDHFPIRSAALQTAELEDIAKEQQNKNSIALFDSYEKNHVYSWEIFIPKVLDEKLSVIQKFLDNNNECGNSMLYRINQLLKDTRGEKRINLARYAYLLARLEPPRKDPRHARYEEFCRKMYDWGLNKSDRTQLLTAILLYVYQTRKESE